MLARHRKRRRTKEHQSGFRFLDLPVDVKLHICRFLDDEDRFEVKRIFKHTQVPYIGKQSIYIDDETTLSTVPDQYLEDIREVTLKNIRYCNLLRKFRNIKDLTINEQLNPEDFPFPDLVNELTKKEPYFQFTFPVSNYQPTVTIPSQISYLNISFYGSELKLVAPHPHSGHTELKLKSLTINPTFDIPVILPPIPTLELLACYYGYILWFNINNYPNLQTLCIRARHIRLEHHRNLRTLHMTEYCHIITRAHLTTANFYISSLENCIFYLLPDLRLIRIERDRSADEKKLAIYVSSRSEKQTYQIHDFDVEKLKTLLRIKSQITSTEIDLSATPLQALEIQKIIGGIIRHPRYDPERNCLQRALFNVFRKFQSGFPL